MAGSGASDDEVVFEMAQFIRVYKSGRVERYFGSDPVPASTDAATGVASKDRAISADVAVRLYLPPATEETDGGSRRKLPILVYFHGGGFCLHTAFNFVFHAYLTSLAARTRAIVVSVEYRLAPEHPLPAAYDDSWAALGWAVSRADPWLSDHGDLGRVFLVGVSAGGNIVHNMALAVGASGLPAAEPARVEGVIELHPSFSGEHKTEVEDEVFFQANNNRWKIIFPGARNGVEDPRINPTADGAPSLTKLAGQRLLVCTASEDPRAPRARDYCDAVRASGWRGEAEWFESEGEGHGFFVLNPRTSTAAALMDRVVGFLAGH